MTKKESNYYFEKLKEHVGHSIDIVGYAKFQTGKGFHSTDEEKDWENISIECIDCCTVLIDFDKKYNERKTSIRQK